MKGDHKLSEKWVRKDLIFVIGLLFFETVTGFAIYFLPFSVFNQANVLIHTLGGLGFLIPYAVYQWRHWQEYRHRPLNHHKLTGYFSFGVTAVAIISGVILTYQALWGRQISYSWRFIHIVSAFSMLFSIVPHLAIILYRNWRNRRKKRMQSVIQAETSFATHTLFLVIAGLTVVLLLWYAYDSPVLNKSFPSDYQLSYGKENPFSPSLASTTHDSLIKANVLGNSQSCGRSGCHEQITEEWEVSAHRYSAMDPAFRKIQENMANQKGPTSTRYCGGCHDPISLFSGSKNLAVDSLTNVHGMKEGVSCISCHSVTKVDVKGNAEYEIKPPQPYLFELNDSKTANLITDFLIRAYPEQHIKSYDRRLLKTPEFCGSCHKQFINEDINNVGWVQLQNQYDNWRKSKWKHPGKATKNIQCRECHMPLVESLDPASGDAADYNRTEDDGKHRSHRFLGGNQFLPTLLDLPGGEKQAELVEKWLKGKINIPEIDEKWTEGPAVPVQIVADDSLKVDGPIHFSVMITNNKTGHKFPTGPLDIIQAWIEVKVKGPSGDTLFTSGTLNEKNFIESGSFVFKAEPVDRYGNRINKHNLWEMVGSRYSRALFPGYSDVAKYSFKLTDKELDKMTDIVQKRGGVAPERPSTVNWEIQARLRYRKFNQYLMNVMFGGPEKNMTAPVTTISSDTMSVHVRLPQQ